MFGSLDAQVLEIVESQLRHQAGEYVANRPRQKEVSDRLDDRTGKPTRA